MKRGWLAGLLPIVLLGCSTQGPRVLVFSKTAGYRHASIPAGIVTIEKLGVANHSGVDASEDASLFNDGTLAKYKSVLPGF
jgi:cytochrome c